MQASAIGIASQTIPEAEVFAAEGFDDILLRYNLLSADKIARLRALTERGQVRVVADKNEVVAAFSAGVSGASNLLGVLVERYRDGPTRRAKPASGAGYGANDLKGKGAALYGSDDVPKAQ